MPPTKATPSKRSAAGRGPVRPLAALALVLAVALPAPPARATLGEPEASVDRDRRALAAVARGATPAVGYTVHVLATGGHTVREYVDPAGVVFAVAWSGFSRPDLDPLLGAYAADYHRAAAAQADRRRGARWARLTGERVVVETWGHMRDLHGRAYAPALLPGGVAIDAIQ